MAPKASPSNAQPAAQKPTAANAWNRGQLYRLPGSGNIARIRQPGLMAMAARGQIPNPVAQDVLRLMAIDNTPSDDDARAQVLERNSRAFVQIAALALVEPKLVLEGPPDYERGEIAPGDLCDQDLMWIYFSVVEGRADALEPFRVS